MLHKGAIQLALAQLLVRNKVKSIEDLMALYQTPGEYSNSLLIEMHELFQSYALRTLTVCVLLILLQMFQSLVTFVSIL